MRWVLTRHAVCANGRAAYERIYDARCGAELAGAPWFCDAAVFAAAGCPAIALGPGSIAQAHTCDEFISLEDLEKGAEFFLGFLRSLGAAQKTIR